MAAECTLRCIAFTPLRKNNLVGLADIHIEPLGLQVRGVTIQAHGERRWIGLPAKPQIGPDDKVMRDDKDKVLYAAVLHFPDPADRQAFENAVIAAVLAKHPEAFDGLAAQKPLIISER
ncbi:hypothetical protein [Microvirga sesbaniae]|uniref:hypothetical protein n=1 Tax=Microvirga sesbaniae TaxID=681392 RepID=UPI0021C765A8|nr:hypothetical protein [Microvirga sp. HBU67692]